jgi:hypothetical protein
MSKYLMCRKILKIFGTKHSEQNLVARAQPRRGKLWWEPKQPHVFSCECKFILLYNVGIDRRHPTDAAARQCYLTLNNLYSLIRPFMYPEFDGTKVRGSHVSRLSSIIHFSFKPLSSLLYYTPRRKEKNITQYMCFFLLDSFAEVVPYSSNHIGCKSLDI